MSKERTISMSILAMIIIMACCMLYVLYDMRNTAEAMKVELDRKAALNTELANINAKLRTQALPVTGDQNTQYKLVFEDENVALYLDKEMSSVLVYNKTHQMFHTSEVK